MQTLVPVTNLLLAHIAISLEYFNISALLLSIALSGLLSLAFCRVVACKVSFICIGLMITGSLLFILDAKQLTYIPSLLIHFFLFVFFSSSLIAGNTPVITRFALLLKGELSSTELDYTHKASVAWSIFMFLLLCEAIIIAYVASIEIWSLFVNFINYLFVMLMFVAEFMVRRRVLKDETEPSFLCFLKSLAKADIKKVIRKK